MPRGSVDGLVWSRLAGLKPETVRAGAAGTWAPGERPVFRIAVLNAPLCYLPRIMEMVGSGPVVKFKPTRITGA